MNLTYDAEVDAAYLSMTDRRRPVDRTVAGEGAAAGINLDFDEDGHLLGVEVLDASRRLPAEALKR